MEREEQGPTEAVTVETVEAVTTPAATSPAAIGTEDLAKVRELVLAANPEVVPDLVRGGSIDELIASVEPAKSAYQRIADSVRASADAVPVVAGAESTAATAPPVVPAGGGSNVIDPNQLAPMSKIAQGLAQRR